MHEAAKGRRNLLYTQLKAVPPFDDMACLTRDGRHVSVVFQRLQEPGIAFGVQQIV